MRNREYSVLTSSHVFPFNDWRYSSVEHDFILDRSLGLSYLVIS